MEDNDEIDDSVNSILDQLKSVPVVAKKAQQLTTSQEISNENIESFVVRYASRLVETATDSVEYISDNVQAAPTAEDVVSLAELIKSTSSALEVLNKINLNNKKLQNSIKIKQMEIDSKQEENEVKASATLLASREEIMRQMFEKAKIIDAVVVEETEK